MEQLKNESLLVFYTNDRGNLLKEGGECLLQFNSIQTDSEKLFDGETLTIKSGGFYKLEVKLQFEGKSYIEGFGNISLLKNKKEKISGKDQPLLEGSVISLEDTFIFSAMVGDTVQIFGTQNSGLDRNLKQDLKTQFRNYFVLTKIRDF